MSVSQFYETVSCAGKLVYATKGEALQVMRRIQGQRRKHAKKRDLRTYRCAACHFWHIGQSAMRIDR